MVPRIFYILHLLSKLSEDDQIICKRVILRNAYFSHCESILLACVSDPDPKIRTVDIDRILRTKTIAASQRDFILPDKINWNAKEYPEMTEWLPETIAVPPILKIGVKNKSVRDLREL